MSAKKALSTADDYKVVGNKYFLLKKYSEAMRFYQKAAELEPKNAIFISNMALCYLKMNRIREAMDASKQAIELNNESVKAHFYLGCCYCDQAMFDLAVETLKRAADLAKQQKMNFGDNICSMLRYAKKKQFELNQTEFNEEMNDFKEYLKQLILNHEQNKASSSSKDCDKPQLSVSGRLEQLNNVFEQVHKANVQQKEVPDYLCGQISFELLKDPLIAPSGITYDKKDIEQHLFKVGHFDPITRQPLTVDQLIPNFALKDVLTAYLEQNPWAEHY